MRLTLAITLMIVLSVCATATQAGWLELVGTPTQVTENGQVGWEYWYDVYSDLAAPTQIWLEGFDGTESLNLHGGSLYQRWDSASAGYTIWGQLGDYPSYRVDKNGPNEWTLNTTDWAMDNPIHGPDDYSGVGGNAMYASTSSEDGIHFWYATNQGYRDGLFMTIRLVHPLAPGNITYSMYGAFYWEQQNAAIIGPAEPTWGWNDFDNDGDVDADDIDILCANMGGDPVPYDVDEDGDVDEDDVVFFIENYVEYDSDGDSVADGDGTFRGDFNLDGVVNGTDLSIMNGNFGSSVGFAGGNANCDTTVNGTDLSILAGNFGNTAAAVVPEPASAVLIAVGACVGLRRRRACRG